MRFPAAHSACWCFLSGLRHETPLSLPWDPQTLGLSYMPLLLPLTCLCLHAECLPGMSLVGARAGVAELCTDGVHI